MGATLEDIQAAVAEFKPKVVHIIAHGQVVGKESVIVLTHYESLGRRNPKADSVSADRLARVLQASKPDARPDAVVLNACNTARVGDVSVAFAAELIRQGIPLVVGMAGEVADSACRLFARQFYSALH
jgi:CHAT domain-containing protein